MTNASTESSTPVPPPSSQSPRPWLPLVLVTAVVAGGLGVLSTYLVMRSSAGQHDVTIACSTVERIGFPLDEDEFRMDTPLLPQLSGLNSFAAAAVIGDDAYAELDEPGRQLHEGLQQADVEIINEALQQMSNACTGIG